jgi:phosphatidylglycerophosphate synthase
MRRRQKLALRSNRERLLNVPNVVTAVGFGLGVWWTQGGPDWAAVASIAADELDGYCARRLRQRTEFGSLFDWGVDLTPTALVLNKLEAPWPAIPAVAAGQVASRYAGVAPPVGSVRALLMAYDILNRRM